MENPLAVRAPSPVDVAFPDRYVARRNFFNWWGVTCRILTEDGRLLAKVYRPPLKLREAITVWADEAETRALLDIRARQIIDFAATYDVVVTGTREVVGALRRKGLRSLLRDQWELMDSVGTVIATIEEDSLVLALVRRLLFNLLPQSYTIAFGAPGELGADPGARSAGEIRGTWNPFVIRYAVDLSRDRARRLDRRLVLAAVALLMLIEGKQR